MVGSPSTTRRLGERTNAERARLSSGFTTKLATTSHSALEIGAPIGEGGMGIVRAATQLSLDRCVAVKTVHPGANESDAEATLREAWVTGFLEHPGVVPVYDIAKDAEGTPIVVMRRIEGETWHARLTDEAWARAAGARDLLEQNLRVFVRVCEVVEFAHAKGVIHRDIKPSNVMIGSFGEVYLLDWGIAVALRGEALRHLPASDTRDVVGTFGYAAPEMVQLVDAPLSEKTDVYLLGAVLFEVATGHRPHRHTNTGSPLGSIDSSPPSVPATVAPRLAEIIRRAMDRSPGDRHEGVAHLRLEVLAYLRARDSEHLVTAAEAALVRMVEECGRGSSARHIDQIHTECRFAFREALRMWPENEAARKGLRVAQTIMIERELARDPSRALTLVEQGEGLAPDLGARVRAAVVVQAAEQQRLAQLSLDNDDTVGRRARRIVFIGLGISWAASILVLGQLGPTTHLRYAIGALIQLAALVVASLFARDLRKTLYSRRIVGSVGIVFVAQFTIYAAGRVLDIPIEVLRTCQIGCWALTASLIAVTLERHFWPSAALLIAAFAVAVGVPSLRSYAAAIAAMGVTTNIALLQSWAARRRPRASCDSCW
jgi:hypothetical protein